jgi:hypothetical protein
VLIMYDNEYNILHSSPMILYNIGDLLSVKNIGDCKSGNTNQWATTAVVTVRSALCC